MTSARGLAVLLCLSSVLNATVADAQARTYSEGGYATHHSVAAGDPIGFHISTATSPFHIEIINLASPYTVLQRIGGFLSEPRDCTGRWERGCQWPLTTTFTVPSRYVPGYYAARFPTSAGDRHILFVVRARVPGSHAPIAVIQPTNTDVAYNRFGGKSVYDTISDDGRRAHVVSFDRPYFEDAGLARYNIWERRFVAWMKAEGRPFEVITDDDMEAGMPLGAYKALLIVGHSEYWSLKARRHLEAYSRSGGHIAIFGANTMWWQVRVDLATRQMTVYKDPALDPLTGVNDDLVTTNFTDWPVLNPENSILGASFLNAAYVNKLNSTDRLPMEARTPYTVRKADHWIFHGTGLTNGSAMGRSVGAIEVDGAIFNTLADGRVVVEGSDGTPPTYEILATLPASDGYATIGMYTNANGGAVFNGGARDWTYGLEDDAVVQTITRNLLDRFAAGGRFDYQPRWTPYRVEDLFNTPPAAPDRLPGWRYQKFDFRITPACAQEGPTGLELAGRRWTQVLRNIAVGRDGLRNAAVSVWLNADLLTQSASYGTPLVSLVDYKGAAGRPAVAAIEIVKRGERPAVRASAFADNSVVSQTDWIVLERGWQQVHLSWESPGMLELTVGGRSVTASNPGSRQKMNAVMIEFAGNELRGSVCLDQLQIRDSLPPGRARRRAAGRGAA